MRAGLLRERVIFQHEVRTPDGAGGSQLGWANLLTVWGQYVPRSAREAVEAGRLQESESGTLTVRASPQTSGITSAHRVLIRGVPYALQGGPTNYDQRNKVLDFIVARGVAT